MYGKYKENEVTHSANKNFFFSDLIFALAQREWTEEGTKEADGGTAGWELWRREVAFEHPISVTLDTMMTTDIGLETNHVSSL